MFDFSRFFKECLTSADQISRSFNLEFSGINRTVPHYPAQINNYYLSLALKAGDPILRQILPDPEEMSVSNEKMAEEPVGEDIYSPVPNLTHRYQDRVLLLISDRCPIYCRFCTRKRKIGRSLRVTDESVREGIDYIKKHPEIRDVLLSGGDPLMLENERLDQILSEIRGYPPCGDPSDWNTSPGRISRKGIG